MSIFEYNPFPELGAYVDYPERRLFRRILLDRASYNKFTGWMIYQALRSW